MRILTADTSPPWLQQGNLGLGGRGQRPEKENPGIKVRAACFKENTSCLQSVVFSGAATMERV